MWEDFRFKNKIKRFKKSVLKMCIQCNKMETFEHDSICVICKLDLIKLSEAMNKVETNLIENSVSLDPEFAKIISENFSKLLV